MVEGRLAVRGRLAGVDVLRGWALLAMVADHVLVLVDPASLLRLTVTRLALPAFALLMGALHRRRWSGRHVQLLAAALVAQLVGAGIIGAPGILWLLAGCVPVLWLPSRWLLLVAVVGWVQASWWPIDWQAYQPGTVLLWTAVGKVASVQLLDAAARVTGPRSVQLLGRLPLSVYLAHLAVLQLVASWWR